MKRMLRIATVIGGLVGVVWALRDRLISIESPKEEEPPTFRVPASNGPPPSVRPADH